MTNIDMEQTAVSRKLLFTFLGLVSILSALIYMLVFSGNQSFFQNLTIETSDWTNYISGEYGLMMALVTAVAAYLFWRKLDSLPEPQR